MVQGPPQIHPSPPPRPPPCLRGGSSPPPPPPIRLLTPEEERARGGRPGSLRARAWGRPLISSRHNTSEGSRQLRRPRICPHLSAEVRLSGARPPSRMIFLVGRSNNGAILPFPGDGGEKTAKHTLPQMCFVLSRKPTCCFQLPVNTPPRASTPKRHHGNESKSTLVAWSLMQSPLQHTVKHKKKKRTTRLCC